MSAILSQLEDSNWVHRLHRLSELALELWPRHSAHWRTAGALVAPPSTLASQNAAQDLAAAMSSGVAAQALTSLYRAVCLRALCSFRGSSRTGRRIAPLMAALVKAGGPNSGHSTLATDLLMTDLHKCIVAVADIRPLPLPDSPLRDFVREGAKRLLNSRPSMRIGELNELRTALQRCGVEHKEVDVALREQLRSVEGSGVPPDLGDVPAIMSCARALGESGVLKSPMLRRALLPESLGGETAAELLPYVLPLEGAPSSAHKFVIAMATKQIATLPKSVETHHLAKSLQGVMMLQAQGEAFAVQHAARVLRALWPRVALKLAHFSPEDMSVALRTYCWQLQYSRQEIAIVGIAREHPIVEMVADVVDGKPMGHSPVREQQHTQDLKERLVRPALSHLGEMPLKHIGACLTAVAPALRPPNVLTESETAELKGTLENIFPAHSGSSEGNSRRWTDFKDEYWAGEVQSLETSELLELVCGLREARADVGWVLDSLLTELEQRLRPPKASRPSVELSHFTLLRLCRVMDLWQGHAVEDMLTRLLSSPDAVKPLPTPYFVAVLSALCSFFVPKEVPLRLVTAFLDGVDCGERAVRPEQWLEVLCAIRPLDEAPSWERVTPRILQQLAPRVRDLAAPELGSLLQALAARSSGGEFGRPQQAGMHGGNRGASDSASDRFPGALCEAVAQAVQSSKWEFEQLVAAFDSLGRLDWYAEPLVASMLAQCARTSLLEPHAPLLLPLSRAFVSLRIHHAPLLHKMVLWYCWCYAYLKPKPLPSEQLEEMLDFTEQLLELSFQSLDLQSILAENLRNPNASARQILALLAALARFSNFPGEFKEACAKVCAESSDSDLTSLTTPHLINAFNIHLCAVFDGPAALKHWLTQDEAMKAFFQVHTSQKWYQRQDQERTAFLQSSAYLTLRDAAEAEGLGLQPSDPGEVYHIELVSRGAKDRLSSPSATPPTALVCIKSKEQLRWYVPITAEGTPEASRLAQNRCLHFRYMFRGAVQKMRHLQAMGYRTAAIWMSDWKRLETQAQRSEYLRVALGAPGPTSTAFSPSSSEEEAAYS